MKGDASISIRNSFLSFRSLKGREDLIKRVLIGILVISAAYWWATVPYAGRYDDSSDELAYPANGEEVADPGKYLREHHLRTGSSPLSMSSKNNGKSLAHFGIITS